MFAIKNEYENVWFNGYGPNRCPVFNKDQIAVYQSKELAIEEVENIIEVYDCYCLSDFKIVELVAK